MSTKNIVHGGRSRTQGRAAHVDGWGGGAAAFSRSGGHAALPVAEQELAEAQRLNINRATAAELETLPGIGPELAGRIIAYREQYGDFLSVDELTAVRGIGEKKLAAIRAYITAG